MAILTAIRMQPGRKYRPSAAPLVSGGVTPLVLGEVTPLVSGGVRSSAGAVVFGGTGSQSAVGQDGLPGIKTAVWKAPLWAV